MNEAQRKELVTLIDKYSKVDGPHETGVPGMVFFRSTRTDIRMSSVYDASMCIVIQGKKEVILEDESYEYAESEYLITPVDLPVIGQITEASPEKPYLNLKIGIDLRQLSELLVDAGQTVQSTCATGRCVLIGKVDETMGDSLLRLARLVDAPQDIPLLAPMITREIYYRLLQGKYGKTLAQFGLNGSNLQRISTVIRKIKSDYAKPIRVEALAELAGMSVSSFHSHFKEVTAMSPLQYQKRLRLMEARQIMLTKAADAASTAYEVGYESASQFSREYARMFGNPPGRDIKILSGAI